MTPPRVRRHLPAITAGSAVLMAVFGVLLALDRLTWATSQLQGLAAAVAVLVVVGVIAFRPPSGTASTGQADGPPTSVSPTGFVLPAHNGTGQVRPADSYGTPTVVNFFASWCSECNAELPGFATVSAQLRGKVTFVGVNALETGDPNVMPTRHHITWWPLARDVGSRRGSGLHDALGRGQRDADHRVRRRGRDAAHRAPRRADRGRAAPDDLPALRPALDLTSPRPAAGHGPVPGRSARCRSRPRPNPPGQAPARSTGDGAMAQEAPGLVAGMERHQVAICVGAIAAGAAVGWAAPGAGPGLAHAINPILGVLLYATFLQVPAVELARSLRAGRFLAATLVINFVVAPLVVAAMFGFLPANQAVRIGVLLVLLTPCVDYVIVFSGLAGANSRRLLAATPLLLIAQMLLLPLFLVLFLGSGLAGVVQIGPFVQAFLVLIVIPLALAWTTQAWAARKPAGAALAQTVSALMVPLMAATLLVVVASQVPELGADVTAVLGVIPFYVGFLIVMAAAGLGVARLLSLDAPDGRAIVFTGATRNSLVVLPLALALPDTLAIAATVVVTQTLVEVVGMVIYVRTVPRLLPQR